MELLDLRDAGEQPAVRPARVRGEHHEQSAGRDHLAQGWATERRVLGEEETVGAGPR